MTIWVDVLAQVLPQTKITTLGLGASFMGDEDISALAQVLPNTQVTYLDLSRNRIGYKVAESLAQVLPQTQITILNLGDNQIKDEGAMALAIVLPQTQITNLYLNNNEIGPEGAIALAQALPQTKITELYMYENRIGVMGSAAFAQALPRTKITYLNLESNNIVAEEAAALAQALPQTQAETTSISFSWVNKYGGKINEDFLIKDSSLSFYNKQLMDEGTVALAEVLPNTQVTSLDLSGNYIGSRGAVSLARVLPKTQITYLNLADNRPVMYDVSDGIGADGAEALAEVLPNTQVKYLDLSGNRIGYKVAESLAQVLPQTQITNLNVGDNQIDDEGVMCLAKVLPQTQITNLNLGDNQIGPEGAAALAQVLPQTQITNLNLGVNQIGPEGAAALAQVLPQTKITSLNLGNIGPMGVKALAQAIKVSFDIVALEYTDDKTLQEVTSLINNHLAINKLLNAKKPEDKTLEEFISELESSALMHINQPKLLDDLSFEKPKRLLLKAIELGSKQAMYLLANLYLNEFKDLDKAKEYYQLASQRGHELSGLCLHLIGQEKSPDILELKELKIKLPRKFSANTTQGMLAARKKDVATISEANLLVSKTGISLTALNELRDINSPLDVFVAIKDYEPVEDGHLPFNQGQTIYMPRFENIEKNFLTFAKEVLPRCFIPYNRGRHGNKRSDSGLVPYDVFINNLRRKSTDEWSAEEVCNATIVPLTAPTL